MCFRQGLLPHDPGIGCHGFQTLKLSSKLMKWLLVKLNSFPLLMRKVLCCLWLSSKSPLGLTVPRQRALLHAFFQCEQYILLLQSQLENLLNHLTLWFRSRSPLKQSALHRPADTRTRKTGAILELSLPHCGNKLPVISLP